MGRFCRCNDKQTGACTRQRACTETPQMALSLRTGVCPSYRNAHIGQTLWSLSAEPAKLGY